MGKRPSWSRRLITRQAGATASAAAVEAQFQRVVGASFRDSSALQIVRVGLSSGRTGTTTAGRHDCSVSYCLSPTNTARAAARRMRATDEQIIQAAELHIIATTTDVARRVEGTD